MDVAPVATDKLTLDEAGCIAEDIACVRCGYNLRGLYPDSVCPECGIAIGHSTHGDLLRFCDPLWVEKLASGMNWIVAGILTSILAVVVVALSGGFTRTTSKSAPIQLIAMIIPALINLIGYWRVTEPDPRKVFEERPFNSRLITRLTTLAAFILHPTQQLSEQLDPVVGSTIGFVGAAVDIVQTFASFIYARQLALRIPDVKLARHTRIVMWGFVVVGILAVAVLLISIATTTPAAAPASLASPALMPVAAMAAVGCPAGLTTLVFGVWALFLLLRYRKAFRTAARLARATWAK